MSIPKPLELVGVAVGVGVGVAAAIYAGVHGFQSLQGRNKKSRPVAMKIYTSNKENYDEPQPLKEIVKFFVPESYYHCPRCVLYDDDDDDPCNKDSYERNIRYISCILCNARNSLDICMCFISNIDLAIAVGDVAARGVKVRIITGMPPCDRGLPGLSFLQRCGERIKLRTMGNADVKPSQRMSHRFVVVDRNTVIAGSANWSDQDSLSSWTDSAVILEPLIVRDFREEFDRLWKGSEESTVPRSKNKPPAFLSISSEWKRDEYHKVFMFGEETLGCRDHMSESFQPEQDHIPHCAFTAVKNLCSLIASADRSVTACFHLLTLPDLADCLVQLFKKGVNVRIIVDTVVAARFGAQIKKLIEVGIDVRCKAYRPTLQHRFIILDDRLILFGSLSWSKQAFCGNWEDLICTNRRGIVRTFNDHFECLWDRFLPVDVKKIDVRPSYNETTVVMQPSNGGIKMHPTNDN